jgi:hypothetical protein
MLPERWREITEGLEIASALLPQERESFRRQVGEPDLELRQELESLLPCESSDPGFFQIPALQSLAQRDWRQINHRAYGRHASFGRTG